MNSSSFSHNRKLSDERGQVEALEASLNAARREADALREQIQVPYAASNFEKHNSIRKVNFLPLFFLNRIVLSCYSVLIWVQSLSELTPTFPVHIIQTFKEENLNIFVYKVYLSQFDILERLISFAKRSSRFVNVDVTHHRQPHWQRQRQYYQTHVQVYRQQTLKLLGHQFYHRFSFQSKYVLSHCKAWTSHRNSSIFITDKFLQSVFNKLVFIDLNYLWRSRLKANF